MSTRQMSGTIAVVCPLPPSRLLISAAVEALHSTVLCTFTPFNVNVSISGYDILISHSRRRHATRYEGMHDQ